MRRSLGFQQQSYGNEGFHEEAAWHSKKDFHKQFSGSAMHLKPGAANYVDFDQFSRRHESFHQDGSSWHSPGGGKFSFAGNGMMNKTHSSGGQLGYVSEDAEYESYMASHQGPTKLRVDEMRYERFNIINDHGRGASAGRKAEWVAKGV